jgi:hypothetical protein
LSALTPIRIVCCLAACLAARAAIIDRVAVSVGNRAITQSAIEREIRVTAFLDGVQPDLSGASRRAAAARMVEQVLVRAELESTSYPAPTAAEVDALLAAFRKQRFAEQAAYQNALAAAGLSDSDVRAQLQWTRTLLLYVDLRFRPAARASETEVAAYFEKTVAPAARAAHPGEEIKLDDYRAEIETVLTGRRTDEELSRWIEEVRARTSVVYHEEAFQ